MKTTEQLKDDIFYEVENSGFLKNIQSQVKAQVLEIIDRQTNANKKKLNFQYEHPLLNKLKKYPLTSLCMDLIQQFLESFKFKHTLNVFKKQINRTMNMNRGNLTKQFSIDLTGKDQAVLLGIVSQLASGDVKILEKTTSHKEKAYEGRKNNFMNEESLNIGKQTEKQKQKPQQKKKNQPFYYEVQQKKPQEPKQEEKKEKQKGKDKKFYEVEEKKEEFSNTESQLKITDESKTEEVEEKKDSKKKKKPEKKEGATDLLEDVVGKFALKKEEKKSSEDQFKARKAFSEEKQKKQVVPEESGANKIRGISAGKGITGMGSMNSFMKFSTFNQQQKNQSQVEEEFDQLQQSRDSTRRNPLFSSSQSGFDKSLGFDQSVDSNAIEDYEYFQRAKRFKKH